VAVRGSDLPGRPICDECARAIHGEIEKELHRLFPTEYVYTCLRHGWPRPVEIRWWAHRVLKKTAKRIWVHTKAIPAEHVGTRKEKRPEPFGTPIVLDREMLERQGWTRNGRRRDSAFYARPNVERVESQEEIDERARREQWQRSAYGPHGLWGGGVGPIRDDLRMLGLSWPCSREEIKAAYRRLALQTHPDRGGSTEAFRRINEAYERLTDAV
jgi:hypothetical protein